MRADPLRGEIWRHVKTGNRYKILYIGMDEATKESVVVYQDVRKFQYPTVWVRKLSVFMEPTDAFGMPRFERQTCDRKEPET